MRAGSHLKGQTAATHNGPDWVKRGARASGKEALLAVAISDDGHFLAAGGGDRCVHVFDARSHQLVQARSAARTGPVFNALSSPWSLRLVSASMLGHKAISRLLLHCALAVCTGPVKTCFLV